MIKKKIRRPRKRLSSRPEIDDSGLYFTPLWKVIYDEAASQNHIIFDKKDLKEFGEDPVTPKLAGEEDEISQTMLSLFNAPDLSTIKSRVRRLSAHRKKQIYRVYLRTLERWQVNYQSHLH